MFIYVAHNGLGYDFVNASDDPEHSEGERKAQLNLLPMLVRWILNLNKISGVGRKQ
ncbi:hypothetical protein FGF1_08750 [Flavobacteriaceae bacterium GF1]